MKNIKRISRYLLEKEQQDVFPREPDPRDEIIKDIMDKLDELTEAVNYLINNK